MITAWKTHAERYVPSIDGCEPSLEYRVENGVEPALGSTPVLEIASYRCLYAKPTGAMKAGSDCIVIFSRYISYPCCK